MILKTILLMTFKIKLITTYFQINQFKIKKVFLKLLKQKKILEKK